MKRQFTIMAETQSDIMMLSIQDLNRMKNEFLECYEKVFENAYNHL